jgi:hypothetical protein
LLPSASQAQSRRFSLSKPAEMRTPAKHLVISVGKKSGVSPIF